MWNVRHMRQRPRLLGISVSVLLVFATCGYVAAFALDWARLYSAALQRFPELAPSTVGVLQAAFGCFSAPTLLAFAAIATAISSRRSLLLPLLFAFLAPVHIAASYVLLALPFAWLAFQVLEASALFLTLRLTRGPNPPLNLDANLPPN